MCSQDARNVILEPSILKIFRGRAPGPTQEPPIQNQNFTPIGNPTVLEQNDHDEQHGM